MSELLKSRIVAKLIRLSVIPFVIISLLTWYFTEKNKFSNVPVVIEFIVFIFILLYYFYEKMKYVKTYPLYQSISFWLCVGLFIFFTGNFFYLLFITTYKDPVFLKQMKIVYSIINITKDIILSLAWLAHEPTEEENTELRIPDDVHLDDEFDFTNKFINS